MKTIFIKMFSQASIKLFVTYCWNWE